jgi:hypothetical protein
MRLVARGGLDGVNAAGLLLLILLAALPASGQQPTWHLISRDDGCVDLQFLVRMEKLSRVPVSPEDFGRMMQERGEQVLVSPLPDSTPDLVGKVVQVKVGNWKTLVFVTEEICRNIDQGR